MADLRVSELAAATEIAGNELVPVVQGGANVSATPQLLQTQTYIERTADWTLALTDRNKDQLFNSGSARVCTIPLNATVAFDIGDQVHFTRLGAGTATIDAESGVTLNGVDGDSIAIDAQYVLVRLKKVGADAWTSSLVEGRTYTPESHAASHQGGSDALAELAPQDTATWETGTGTTETVVSPEKVAAAIAALGGGGGSPGGSSGQVQYNNAGAFGGIAGTSWASNQLLITAQDAAVTPLAIRAAASQTADLQVWQNSAGTALGSILADGSVRTPRLYGQSGSGGISYPSGVCSLTNFNGVACLGVPNSGYGIFPTGMGFGPNVFTLQTSLYQVASAVLGLRGSATSVGAALNLLEQTAPSAPAANQVHIYAEDNGSGKTRLMALFASGAAQQIAIEP